MRRPKFLPAIFSHYSHGFAGTTKWPASVRALLVPGFRRVVEPSINLVVLGFLFPVLHGLAMFPFGRSRRPDRDLDALKRQQIEALKQAVPTARAVNSVRVPKMQGFIHLTFSDVGLWFLSVEI